MKSSRAQLYCSLLSWLLRGFFCPFRWRIQGWFCSKKLYIQEYNTSTKTYHFRQTVSNWAEHINGQWNRFNWSKMTVRLCLLDPTLNQQQPWERLSVAAVEQLGLPEYDGSSCQPRKTNIARRIALTVISNAAMEYLFNSLFLDKRRRMSRHTGHHRIMEPLEPTALVMMVLEAV